MDIPVFSWVPDTSYHRHFIFFGTSYQREKMSLHTSHFIPVHFIPKDTSYHDTSYQCTSYQVHFIPSHFIPSGTSYQVQFIPNALHTKPLHTMLYFIPSALHTKPLHTKCTSYKVTSYQVHLIQNHFILRALHTKSNIRSFCWKYTVRIGPSDNGNIRYLPWLIIDIRNIYRPWSDS